MTALHTGETTIADAAAQGARRIRVLASDLVNQIAAGEVVERPASVVKELVENAIDAGARTIDVILRDGGKALIEVRDDGSGMAAVDAVTALQRHATSKIAAFEDLLSVRSLGFRGEALPSIASVSRFSLVTCDGIEPHGVEVSVDPAGVTHSRPAGRDRGTTISVAELFENVPARRKFLRSADAEYRAVVGVITSYALAAPLLSFRLEHNGRTTLDLAAAVDVRERVLQILGNDLEPSLAPIEGTLRESNVSGFVTRGVRYGSRRNQYFFVNQRLVRDRVLSHAASRACEAFDFDGHPAIIVFLDIPPVEVDVNVHPAKTEVRFRDSGRIHVLVEEAVRRALGGAQGGQNLLSPPAAADSGSVFSGSVRETTFFPPMIAAADASLWQPEATPLFRGESVVQPPREWRESIAAPSAPVDLGDLRGRVIGQYRMSYIILDTPEGLRLVDQHVAHERVLYDRIDARMGQDASSQQLLSPMMAEFSAAEAAILDTHLEELANAGFDLERFSGSAFAIRAVPAVLPREGVIKFLRKLLDASIEEKGSHLGRVREKVVASLACQAAIKVHRQLSGDEMARLVAELLDSSNPFACPHGRPIIVDIRHLDIERHFHRK